MKQLIKSILGQSNWDILVSRTKFVKNSYYFTSSKTPRLKAFTGWSSCEFSLPHTHTFFGYYDIQQLNQTEDRLLAHTVDLNAKTNRDEAKIGYFSLQDNVFHPISASKAWCWQQGSRLRWHPIDQDCILFNDAANHCYITKIVKADNGEEIGTIPMALYDVDAKFSFGLSLNFSRLQRLRPGYGYDVLPDLTTGIKAPDDDGVFYVDLRNGTSHLLISLKSLAKQADPELKYEHYINHISISPNGERFMFFHVYNLSSGKWKTRLCVYDLPKSSTRILEEEDNVSHYDWVDDHTLLVTCFTMEKKQYYAIYDAIGGKKIILTSEGLDKDGHPSLYSDGRRFISDTYPLENNIQHLFEYDMDTNRRMEIVAAYSSSLLYGEKRCDLHPRLSASQQFITFDSTFSENRRKIVLLRRKQK